MKIDVYVKVRIKKLEEPWCLFDCIETYLSKLPDDGLFLDNHSWI